MHRTSRSSSPVATAIPTPDTPDRLVTLGALRDGGRAPAASGASVPAELARYLTEDHDRMARDISDVVIHRIFAAGLDLHAALEMIGDDRGASNIHHAIDELDRAVRDIRDTILEREPCQA
jgi:signal transduction histidine kinase